MFKEPLSDFFKKIKRASAYGASIETFNPPDQQKEIKENPPSLSQEDDMEKYIRENPKKVKEEYVRIYNGYWFERAYNLIYGTQIDLLEYLIEKGTNGESYVNLYKFYQEYINRSQLHSYQFADYIGFLKNMNFIEMSGEGTNLVVKINPLGIDFISYIKGQYSNSYKFRLW